MAGKNEKRIELAGSQTEEAALLTITIEELREQKQTSAAVFAGASIKKGWRSGKQVTEAEYDTALAEFIDSSADGKGKGK